MKLLARIGPAPVVLILFASAVALRAEPLTIPAPLTSLPREYVTAVSRDGVAMRHVSRADELLLQPDHPFAALIEESLASANPNILTESLMLLPFAVSDGEFLALYNSLRRVSDLADVEYWNEERRRYFDLFTTSFCVAGRNDPRRLPDPLVATIPTHEDIYVLQDIPPFHEAVSRYEYRSDGRSFLFSGVNLDRIRYRGFPVVGRENMINHLMVLRGQDYLVVYGVGGARVTNPLGLLSGRIEGPFRFRTMGLFQWYYDSHVQPLRRRAQRPIFLNTIRMVLSRMRMSNSSDMFFT